MKRDSSLCTGTKPKEPGRTLPNLEDSQGKTEDLIYILSSKENSQEDRPSRAHQLKRTTIGSSAVAVAVAPGDQTMPQAGSTAWKGLLWRDVESKGFRVSQPCHEDSGKAGKVRVPAEKRSLCEAAKVKFKLQRLSQLGCQKHGTLSRYQVDPVQERTRVCCRKKDVGAD